MLEDQRDLEIIDAEYNAYTEVELRSNNKVKVDSTIPLPMYRDGVTHNRIS